MKKLILSATVLCLSISGGMAESPEAISYSSIPPMVAKKQIQKAEIYDSSHGRIDFILTLKDGVSYSVNRPYGVDQDSILHQYLNDNDIEYIIYDRKYEETEDDEKWYSSASLMGVLPLIFMLGVPILLILIVWRQAKTISKQTDIINKLTDTPQQ